MGLVVVLLLERISQRAKDSSKCIQMFCPSTKCVHTSHTGKLCWFNPRKVKHLPTSQTRPTFCKWLQNRIALAFASKSLQSLIHCGCLVFLPLSLSLSLCNCRRVLETRRAGNNFAIRSVNLWRVLHVNNLSEANLNMSNQLFLCLGGKNQCSVISETGLTQSRTKYSAVLNETFVSHHSHVQHIHRRGISWHFQMQDNTDAHTHTHTHTHMVGTCLHGWCEAAFCSRPHAPI